MTSNFELTSEAPSLEQRASNPYPRNCEKCRPLLAKKILPDPTLCHKTKDQLVEKVETARVKIRNQGVRLRHLDHELSEMQTAMLEASMESERAGDEEQKLRSRLQHFGLLPSQKKKLALDDEELHNGTHDKFELVEEDIDAINDINMTLKVLKYSAAYVGEPRVLKSCFPVVDTISLTAEDLTSYYDLGNIILGAADMLTLNSNVVIAVEVVPRIGDSVYHRILHHGKFATWVQGMKMLRGGEYEILAYVYSSKDGEAAAKQLEVAANILKY